MRTASLHERCLYPFFPAQLPVGVAGIARIPSDFLRIHTEKPPAHLQAVRQPRPLVEGSVDGTDDFHVPSLSGCQQVIRPRILPLNPAYLIQYLPQKVKQASSYLPGLRLRASALLPVRKVGFLHVKVLRPRTVKHQFFTHHTLSCMPSLSHTTATSGLSGIASHSRSRSHPCTPSPVPSCMASRLSPVPPSSARRQVLKTHRQEACSSSVDASGLSSHRRTTGSGCSRSTVPSVSESSVPYTSSGTSAQPCPRREVRSAASLHSHALLCQS